MFPNTNKSQDKKKDELYKLRPLIDILMPNFRKYKP